MLSPSILIIFVPGHQQPHPLTYLWFGKGRLSLCSILQVCHIIIAVYAFIHISVYFLRIGLHLFNSNTSLFSGRWCHRYSFCLFDSFLRLTHWPLGNFNEILDTQFSNWFQWLWLRHLLWNYPHMNVTGLHWWSVNIGSGNGLVPSGNKPLPEPMLSRICHHMLSLARNELTDQSYFDGLVQDCSISIADALQIMQSCTKPLVYNKWLTFNIIS